MNRILQLTAVLTVAAVTYSAPAAQLTYNNNGPGGTVTISYPGQSNRQVFAGALACSLTGAPADYPTQFSTFCVDLQHSISRGQTWDVNLTPLPHPGLNEGGRIGYLYTNFGSGLNTNDSASGLQLAIWDLATDNGDGLASGSFQVNAAPAATIAAASNYLAISAGRTASATWFVSADGSKQNQVGAQAVAEPGSMALIGTLLLPMLGFSRRRR